jgi:transposase
MRTGACRLDQVIAEMALEERSIRLLLTVPGVNLITAAVFIGRCRRHRPLREPEPTRELPRAGPQGPPIRDRPRPPRLHLQAGMRRCALGPCRVGLGDGSRSGTSSRLRRADPSSTRRQRGDGCRGAKTRGALLAHAHKDEEYAFGRPSLTAEKLRRMELTAGAPRVRGKRSGGRVLASAEQRLREQQVAVHAETAYRQFVSQRRKLARTCGCRKGHPRLRQGTRY